MKSVTIKIIIAVLSTLIVVGSAFGILVATGVIEFSSDDSSKREKTSDVSKDKEEKTSDKTEKKSQKKQEDPADILKKIEGRWGYFNDKSSSNQAFFVVIKNEGDEYSFQKGLMWTDYLEFGKINDISKTGDGEYQITVHFPEVDNELEHINEHTDTISIDINELDADKLIMDDTEFNKIKQENIEDYFKEFVDF